MYKINNRKIGQYYAMLILFLMICSYFLYAYSMNDAISCTISPAAVDFDNVWAGEEQNTNLQIQNTSIKTVTVKKITSDCFLQVKNLSEGIELKPQEKINCQLYMKTPRTYEKISREVKILLADPKGWKQEITLPVQFRGHIPLQCVPKRLLIANYPAEMEWSQEIVIDGLAADTIQNVSFEEMSSNIGIIHTGFIGNKPNLLYTLKLVSNGFPQGNIMEGIAIHDNRLHRKDIVIPILGYAAEPYAAIPASLFLTKSDCQAQKPSTIKIRSNTGRKIKVQQVECENPLFTFDNEPSEMRNEQAVTLHPVKDAQWEAIHASRLLVQLQTEIPETKTLGIPISIK